MRLSIISHKEFMHALGTTTNAKTEGCPRQTGYILDKIQTTQFRETQLPAGGVEGAQHDLNMSRTRIIAEPGTFFVLGVGARVVLVAAFAEVLRTGVTPVSAPSTALTVAAASGVSAIVGPDVIMPVFLKAGGDSLPVTIFLGGPSGCSSD